MACSKPVVRDKAIRTKRRSVRHHERKWSVTSRRYKDIPEYRQCQEDGQAQDRICTIHDRVL